VYKLDRLGVQHWRYNRFAHPRSTSEKSLCDWLYLEALPRSLMRPPPLDLEIERRDADCLQRVARAMPNQQHLDQWLRSKRSYAGDPGVIENAPMHVKVSQP
jgi:hypothetical protein